MDWQKFTVGFWHPFGPHAGESRDHILSRKSKEVEDTGWTLWSFQPRKTLAEWRHWLPPKNSNDRVYVLCSDSKNTAKDPKGEVANCKYYSSPLDNKWAIIPGTMSVPHPFRGEYASAFVVQRVLHPIRFRNPNFQIEWYHTENRIWSSNNLPTRPEYLIRKGGYSILRSVYAVLELYYPYVVILKK